MDRAGRVIDTTRQNGRRSWLRAISKSLWRAANTVSSSKSIWLVRVHGPAWVTESMLWYQGGRISKCVQSGVQPKSAG